MTQQNTSKDVPKVYQYSPMLAMYGIGNAGLTFGYFEMLNNIKAEIGDKFTYHDAIDSIHYWKQYIESTPQYKGIFGAIGVCGITDHVPKSKTILIDSEDYKKFEHDLSANENLSFYILPPADLSNEMCNNQFKECFRYVCKPLNLQILIDLCSIVIQNLSHISDGINDHVQYWAYDLRSKTVKSQLIEALPSK